MSSCGPRWSGARPRYGRRVRDSERPRADDPDLRPLLPRVLHREVRRSELIALDGLVAAGYALVVLLGPMVRATGVAGWLRWLLAIAITGAMVGRRVRPALSLGVASVASVVALSLGLLRDPLLSMVYVLYPVAVTAPRRRWEPTLVVGGLSVACAVGTPLVGVVPGTTGTAVQVGLGAILLGCSWTLGRAVRERRTYAARIATHAAERAVAEERLRIARELHDIVSHTLSLIGVKAAVANHVADSRPEEVRDALRVIEATSRDALTQMRHMLGVLRSDQAPAGWAEPGSGPAPGIAGLAELVNRAASAGVHVELTVHGVDRLARGVELSVYRIVQEAVTNVIRHAAPAQCRVTVEGRAGNVLIEVTNDGPGGRSGPAGGRAGPRPHRDAGTGPHARRDVHGRPSTGRRLPGHREPAR